MIYTLLARAEISFLYCLATAEAQFGWLQSRPIIEEFSKKLLSGEISEKDIIECIETWEKSLKTGCLWEYEYELIFIITALYKANKYTYIIEKLAKLNIAEMPYSTRVAKVILRGLVQNAAKNFT